MTYASTTHALVSMRAADIMEASAAAYFGPQDRQTKHVATLEDRFRLLASALGYSVSKIEPASLEAAE